MLDMILRSMLHLLAMDPDGTVAVAASYASGGRADRVRYRDVLPAPFRLPIDKKFPALLATGHEVVRHLSLPGLTAVLEFPE